MTHKPSEARPTRIGERLVISLLLVPGTVVFALSDWLMNESIWFLPLVIAAAIAVVYAAKRLWDRG